MMDNNYIDTNICICYSPDEQTYYLERREPNNWAVSQDFNTPAEAESAYKNNEVEWILD